jgi:hypothetical protein
MVQGRQSSRRSISLINDEAVAEDDPPPEHDQDDHECSERLTKQKATRREELPTYTLMNY